MYVTAILPLFDIPLKNLFITFRGFRQTLQNFSTILLRGPESTLMKTYYTPEVLHKPQENRHFTKSSLQKPCPSSSFSRNFFQMVSCPRVLCKSSEKFCNTFQRSEENPDRHLTIEKACYLNEFNPENYIFFRSKAEIKT